MGFTRSEILFLAVIGIAVTLAGVAFTLDRPQSLRAKDARPVGATVVGRGVERKVDRDVVWEKIGPKQVVYRRDSIRTGRGAAASIQLQDGSEIRMDGESLIFLDVGDGDMRIVFDHGSVGLSRGSSSGGGGKAMTLSLQGAGGTLKIEAGASISASAVRGESLSVQVETGRATLTSPGGKPVVVEEGKSAQSVLGEREIKVVPIDIRLRSPAHGESSLLTGPASTVAFAWDSPGLSGGELLIAEEGSGKVVQSVPVTASTWTWTQPGVGRYRWWVRGVDGRGQKVESQPRTFNLDRDAGVSLFYPNSGAVFSFVYKAPILPFSWSANPLARAYELVVSADNTFKEAAILQRVTENRLSLRNLGEGEWFWKVRYLLPDGETWGESPARSFSVQKELEPEPPVIFSPVEGARVASEVFGEKGLLLAWKGRGEAARYVYTFEGPGGTRSGAVNQSFVKLVEPLSPGDWRVQIKLVAIREDGSTNYVPSPWRTFAVLAPLPPKPKEPVAGKGTADPSGSTPEKSTIPPVAMVSNAGQTNTNVSAMPPVVPPVVRAPVVPPRVVVPPMAPERTAVAMVTNPALTSGQANSNTAGKFNETAVTAPPPKPKGKGLRWEPATASVLVNGAPWVLGNLLVPGEYAVSLEKDGYLPVKTNLVVSPDDSGIVNIALRKKRMKGEEILLIDGTRLAGRILESDRDSVVIEVAGKKQRVDRADIERIQSVRDEGP